MRLGRIFFGIVLVTGLLFSNALGTQAGAELNLMPIPKSLELGSGRLEIDGGFQAVLSGYSEPRLVRAAERMLERLSLMTGIPLQPVREDRPRSADLIIQCQGPGENPQTVAEDETYLLDIDPTRAQLKAATPVGVLRGIETFLQLISVDRAGFHVPVVRIQDAPRFPWRGLLIDSGRHWLPVDVIKRNLDGMAAVKLNVLHWHLSEDQGFRIECRRYPKLHELGSDGDYYTQDQIRDILTYARDRGIRVIPEFDMPGHSTSWFVGYPELASRPGPYRIIRTWGIQDPCMDPTKESVYVFLDGFIAEMAKLFPDEYFHIGGDEVNGRHWNGNPQITEFKRRHGMKDNHDLQAYFNQRVQQLLAKYGKKMAGWDEIFHPSLPKDVLIQSWRGQESLARTSRAGYPGILSNGYYLDHILSAEFHYGVDPLAEAAAQLPPHEQSLILGGEACMWSEFVNPETIDSRIWPRMAAIAERFWSPQSVRDINDMYRRLEIVNRNLDWLGLIHRSRYPLMLERLLGPDSTGAQVCLLHNLASLLEPVKYYTRPGTRNYTQHTPFNRLVDAARPESLVSREFKIQVDDFLAHAPDYETNKSAIREILNGWRINHDLLLPSLKNSLLLQEIIPLSLTVKSAAEIGLEALQTLEGKGTPAVTWLEKVSPILVQPKRPLYELQIMVLPALRDLTEAAYKKAHPEKQENTYLQILYEDNFRAGNARGWKPNIAGNWKVKEEEGNHVFSLLTPGPQGKVRAPTSWALIERHDVTSFSLTGRLKCEADPANPNRDMLVIFHFQDPTHFYYVHFSASSDGLHNIIGLVDGKDRVKINLEEAGKSKFRLTDQKYHNFKVTYSALTGDIKAYLDDMTLPILTANDKTLGHGQVGVGSFDDTGSFDDIILWGKTWKEKQHE
jgi:hexosaminidase